MRVLREVTLAAGERGRGARERRRLLEIGNIYSPGFFGTPYTPGNKVVADATYIRSDLVGGGVDGTMYSIPWTLLYTCVSIKCIEAANALVGEVTINYYHIWDSIPKIEHGECPRRGGHDQLLPYMGQYS